MCLVEQKSWNTLHEQLLFFSTYLEHRYLNIIIFGEMPHFGKCVLCWSWRERKYHEKQNILYEIAGFRRDVGENCALLGCYKALQTFRDK